MIWIDKFLGGWWKLSSILRLNLLRLNGVRIGMDAKLLGKINLYRMQGKGISIGHRCVLSSDFQANPLNRGAYVSFTLLEKNSLISIGNDCGLSSCSIISKISVKIGNEVLVGAGVIITDTDFHKIGSYNRRYHSNQVDIACKPVCIEDNVWLGANVMILKGVTIGRNSVVAAGSIVTKTVAPDTLVAGIPARAIKKIDSI